MTANQIAAAAQREEVRHNQATEEETARSNKANEEIRERANQIEEEKNEIIDNHNKEMEALEKRKQDLEYELNKADVENREWYQQQIAAIEQQKAAAQATYQENMAAIAAREATVKEEAEEEVKRHDQAQEAINKSYNDIMNKKLEYEKHQWDTENALAKERNEISRMAMLNDAYFNQQKRRQDYYQFQKTLELQERETKVLETQSNFQNSLLAAQAKREKSQTVKNYYGIFTDTADLGIRAFQSLAPTLDLNIGGNSNGKTTKSPQQQFEELFE